MPTTLLSLSDELLEVITWHIVLGEPEWNERSRGWVTSIGSDVAEPSSWALSCRRLERIVQGVLDRFVCFNDPWRFANWAAKVNGYRSRAALANCLVLDMADASDKVESVTATVATLRQLAPALSGLVRLEIVVTKAMRDQMLYALDQLTQLRHLFVSAASNDMTADTGFFTALSVATAAGDGSASRLRSFHLHNFSSGDGSSTSEKGSTDSPLFPNIRQLGITSKEASHQTSPLLELGLYHCPSVEHLVFNAVGEADDECRRRLRRALRTTAPHLKRLSWSMDENANSLDHLFSDLLARASQLETLRLKDVRIEGTQLQHLSRLRSIQLVCYFEGELRDAQAEVQHIAAFSLFLMTSKSLQVVYLTSELDDALEESIRVRPGLFASSDALQAICAIRGIELSLSNLEWYTPTVP